MPDQKVVCGFQRQLLYLGVAGEQPPCLIGEQLLDGLVLSQLSRHVLTKAGPKGQGTEQDDDDSWEDEDAENCGEEGRRGVG